MSESDRELREQVERLQAELKGARGELEAIRGDIDERVTSAIRDTRTQADDVRGRYEEQRSLTATIELEREGFQREASRLRASLERARENWRTAVVKFPELERILGGTDPALVRPERAWLSPAFWYLSLALAWSVGAVVGFLMARH